MCGWALDSLVWFRRAKCMKKHGHAAKNLYPASSKRPIREQMINDRYSTIMARMKMGSEWWECHKWWIAESARQKGAQRKPKSWRLWIICNIKKREKFALSVISAVLSASVTLLTFGLVSVVLCVADDNVRSWWRADGTTSCDDWQCHSCVKWQWRCGWCCWTG